MLNLLFQTRKAFALTAGVFSILYGSYALAACSVHDHGCVYHAGGAKVSSTYNPTGPTSLVMYTIGTNGSGGAARTDFDTHALLPSMTGDPKLGLGYTQPTGPYIVNTTPYGATHTPPTWNSSTELPLHVYPSQYGVTFNSNTAVATHTGDFNGGENGNIPGATGCPNMPGAPNCEAVVVTGNVPNGIYQQQVQLFNYYNLPNPSVDLQVGAYTTGSAVLVTPGHTATETANFTSLSGSGSYTPVYSYEVYNRGFDPHAAGVAFFDRTKSRSHSEITTGDHTRTTYKVTDFAKVRTLIDAQGNAAQRVMAQWQTRTAVKAEATCTQIAGMCVSSAQLAHLAATMKMPQPGQSPFGCIGVGCPSVNPIELYARNQIALANSFPKDAVGYYDKRINQTALDSILSQISALPIDSPWRNSLISALPPAVQKSDFVVASVVKDPVADFVFDTAATFGISAIERSAVSIVGFATGKIGGIGGNNGLLSTAWKNELTIPEKSIRPKTNEFRSDAYTESVNASDALVRKLSALEDAQSTAVSVRILPDGRIRYYNAEIAARTPGPSRGASYVTEWNPVNGSVRSWNEVYDQAGNVNRIHPKMINGQVVDSQHYPPTAMELESWR